jgi:hypothetical protein
MKKLIFIFAILLTSCSSLQLQLATMNHASVQNHWRPRTNTGFTYVLPSTTPYTWNNFTFNRFYQPNSLFYSWNYPLNWYYPNQFGYAFNYNNIVSPRRVVRRTPTRPQIQPRPTIRRPRITPTRTRTMNTQPDVQRRPQTRPQTRVSTSNTRRGKSNIKQ